MRMLLIVVSLSVALLAGACDRSPASSGQASPTSQPAGQMATCPTCGGTHEFAVTDTTPRTELNGKTYYFCSEPCRQAFIKNPSKYLKK